MQILGFLVLLFCVVAYASAGLGRNSWPPRSTGPNIPRFPKGLPRFRREADPQGSISIQGTKPLSGPDRRPSLDVDYNHRVYDRNGLNANAYGGLNIRPGQPAQPHLGLQVERNYRNGFIRGFGQAERGGHGRISPTFGVSTGFRFRRDLEDQANIEEEEY